MNTKCLIVRGKQLNALKITPVFPIHGKQLNLVPSAIIQDCFAQNRLNKKNKVCSNFFFAAYAFFLKHSSKNLTQTKWKYELGYLSKTDDTMPVSYVIWANISTTWFYYKFIFTWYPVFECNHTKILYYFNLPIIGHQRIIFEKLIGLSSWKVS